MQRLRLILILRPDPATAGETKEERRAPDTDPTPVRKNPTPDIPELSHASAIRIDPAGSSAADPQLRHHKTQKYKFPFFLMR